MLGDQEPGSKQQRDLMGSKRLARAGRKRRRLLRDLEQTVRERHSRWWGLYEQRVTQDFIWSEPRRQDRRPCDVDKCRGAGQWESRTAPRWARISVSDASKGICMGIIYSGNKQALI